MPIAPIPTAAGSPTAPPPTVSAKPSGAAASIAPPSLRPVESDALRLVTARYGFCCNQPTFFDDFYGNFLRQSADIRKMFEKTDMQRQKDLLRAGLSFLLLFAGGKSSIAKNKVEGLAESHSRGKLNVPPSYYDLWIASLLTTVQKHDPLYDASHERAWRAVLERGIAVMKARY